MNGNNQTPTPDTFLFFPSILEAVEAMRSTEAQYLALLAVAKYGCRGEMPDFADIDPLGSLDALFTQWAKAIDTAKENYKTLSQKRREAGQSGGAPKGNRNAAKRTTAPDDDTEDTAPTSQTSDTKAVPLTFTNNGEQIAPPEWESDFIEFWNARKQQMPYKDFMRMELNYCLHWGQWRSWKSLKTRYYKVMRDLQS